LEVEAGEGVVEMVEETAAACVVAGTEGREVVWLGELVVVSGAVETVAVVMATAVCMRFASAVD